ncbi:MAG: chalcone isomerase family protein [Rhodoferax sp.]|jgi:hypothetical protein|nr:chalcone isomerase family protein [Rhodoferax sp.]MBP9685270.1 chalcone isomerase family protein [Rhodoferax sp.]
MKKLVTAIAAALALNIAFAAELEGVKFDDQVKVGSSDLVINGTGVRTFLGKRYVAALYVTAKTADAGSIMNAKGSNRIALTLLKDSDGKTFGKAFASAIDDNSSDSEFAAIKDRVAALEKNMIAMSDVAKGGVVLIDWIPEKGTHISINGKMVGNVIPGEDFHKAMLKIWLGEKPVQKDLKDSLLGKAS